MGKSADLGAPVEVHEATRDSLTSPSSAAGEDSAQLLLMTGPSHAETNGEPRVYKVYKRRFFGLAQLILLNIVVSWDWITFAPVSNLAAQYFHTSEAIINWLSTAFLFAFCVATPFTFWTLAKRGPRDAIIVASILILVGNWVKYAGTKANSFGVCMLGQLLIGLAQPFVLSAPTTYSNLWFSPAGRTSATAVASLANPLGAALGQLISPFWATTANQIPDAVLYTAIISSVASLPSFFIPSRPPSPPSPALSVPDVHNSVKSLKADVYTLAVSPEFYLLFIPFSVLVGFFNAFSSLLNQLLEPYPTFNDNDAGIAGALLIFVGLASAAVSSPLIDRFKFYLLYIKCVLPIICLMYLLFVWAPQTQSLAFVYVVCALLGASSFGLVPVVLEFLVEIHYPLGVEVGSTLCWSGGQLLGGVFIIIMDALKGNGGGANSGNPPGEMKRALIFEAVIALAVMPLPLCLGLFGRREFVRRKRWEIEQRERAAQRGTSASNDVTE